MASLSEYVALEVNDEQVSLYDLLILAKLNRTLGFIESGIDAELIRQAAEQQGIEVADEELQQAADDFRAARELNDSDATERWLAANRLSYEDWEFLLEQQIVARKLRSAVTSDGVEQCFAERRLSFDAATVSRIVLSEEGVARELRAQIVEDGADFHALAREHSIDASTRMAGGFAGMMHRSEMEAALESAVFGAQPGKVIGPLKTDEGWQLIKLESLHPAVLDDAMRETIRSLLFEEWLSEQRRKARISIPLLEEADEAEPEADVE